VELFLQNVREALVRVPRESLRSTIRLKAMLVVHQEDEWVYFVVTVVTGEGKEGWVRGKSRGRRRRREKFGRNSKKKKIKKKRKIILTRTQGPQQPSIHPIFSFSAPSGEKKRFE
jgi:hypothetical protein